MQQEQFDDGDNNSNILIYNARHGLNFRSSLAYTRGVGDSFSYMRSCKCLIKQVSL